MRIWPGAAYPLGATWDGWGTNFALFSEAGERVELCLFDESADRGALTETRVDSPRPTASYGTDTCRASHRGSATVTACTVRTIPRGACAATRIQAAARPVRQGGRGRRPLERGAVRLPVRAARPAQSTCRQRAVRAQERGDQPVLRLGRRPAAPRRPGTRRSSTRPTCAGSPCATRTSRGAARHLRGLAHPAVIEHLQKLGVTAVELMPVHQFVRRRLPGREAACPTTGATTPSASSPRTSATRQHGPAGRAGAASSSRWSRRCTRRASR